FFLTGGTALSRVYYRHRYSDDLDFFVNSSKEYDKQIEIIFSKLTEAFFLGCLFGIYPERQLRIV
ncbi:MAG: nucleotidyl transferase AbiEii/AbiGii toxin family protein, partial [Treponema sp.]|nr:nucleotidyl transferase AbiEii/AbiGii toxin family protein [Treponema sp.]